MTYDVFSKLNPEYERTGNLSDYYGIYEVYAVVDGKPVGDPIAVFVEDRQKAYRLVRKLIEEQTPPLP